MEMKILLVLLSVSALSPSVQVRGRKYTTVIKDVDLVFSARSVGLHLAWWCIHVLHVSVNAQTLGLVTNDNDVDPQLRFCSVHGTHWTRWPRARKQIDWMRRISLEQHHGIHVS